MESPLGHMSRGNRLGPTDNESTDLALCGAGRFSIMPLGDTSLKVLVTGGAGFIGSNLAECLLEMGHSVRILDNFSEGDRRNLEDLKGDLEIMEGDITRSEDCARACRGVDLVTHQAALGSVPRSVVMPELYSFHNLHGFVTLCNQARLAGVTRIVYASSSSIYGDLKESPISETNRGLPLSPYAASKQGNEDFAAAFHYAHGMTLVGLRYFNVFGPKQNPRGPYAAVIPLFVSQLLRGESPTIFGSGEQSRDFVYVRNVAQSNILGLFGDLPPGAHLINVGSGQRTTINDLYRLIALALHSSITPIHVEERKGDIRDSLADIQRAKSLLGYENSIDIHEGISRTVEWCRNHPDRLR
ncbi:epimerase [Geothrix oryzae]|uniref:Epimerase n=1 Tax=Geothrix oryzae TaxID=2927975 RepID=A0ABM8DTS8_9BACT|nr:NAD-dependent epimerase/dehydratase family protein [Geothrix oryzae]BDU70455.1 epimerase [Geothrix oryzae]